jgi:hypothetical protein
MAGTCASCGHPQEQRYCQRCGEERLDPRQLTLWYFLTRTLPAEISDLDGKIWRTLRLLLCRPGLLAVEYAAGRRRPYVMPMRMLLTAIIVYALLMPSGTTFTLEIPGIPIRFNVAPARLQQGQSIEGTLYRIDRFDVLRRMYEKKMGPAASATADVTKRFSGMLGAVATPLSFASVLMFALVLYASFNRRRPLMLEHAVFSMHYFSFVLVSALMQLAVFRAAMALQGPALAIAFLLVFSVWQLAYLGVAIRRFYFAGTRQGVAWPAAMLLALLLYMLNTFFITAVQFLAAAVAIWRL